jgi:hypothetical protein
LFPDRGPADTEASDIRDLMAIANAGETPLRSLSTFDQPVSLSIKRRLRADTARVSELEDQVQAMYIELTRLEGQFGIRSDAPAPRPALERGPGEEDFPERSPIDTSQIN